MRSTAKCAAVIVGIGALLGAGACSSSGGGGSTGTGGSGAVGGGGGASAISGLPTPPVADGQPQPSGTAGDLKVLPWAGFKSALSWTFDDSQPSQIAHYPELAAVGIPMTFYISTANNTETGYDATWTQAIADGSEIGNHTVHHCHADLTGCSFGTPLATLADELDQATSYIAQTYPAQGDCWTAASPFGDTGYDMTDQTRFMINRGVGGGTIAAGDNSDAFNLPIYLAQMGDTAGIFEAQIQNAQNAGHWLILLVHTISPTDQVWYNPVDVGELTTAMTYGKTTGSSWNDSVVHVGAYWLGQKLLSAATPATSGGAQTWTWTLPPHFPPGRYLRVTVAGGTLTQGGSALPWDGHGYYEVALDAGSLTLSP